MDRRELEAWVAAYERAWRTPGTESLERLFAPTATYSPAPFAPSIVGLAAIAEMWDQEREGPDEVFSMASEVVAVEEDTGVVRVQVDYGRTERPSYRDLWIVTLDHTGRCTSFEEWPFWPEGEDGGIAGGGGK